MQDNIGKKKICIVAEAWGRQEEIYQRPFVGAAGDELNNLLVDSGIMPPCNDPYSERDKYVTLLNTFNFRPPAADNSILSICCKRKDLPDKGIGYKLPALTMGYYVRPEYLGELDRLKRDIEELKPNIVICLGNTALWAMTQRTGIDKFHGAIMDSSLIPGQKCVATYHPASLFRVWNRRTALVMDLMKAKEEASTHRIERQSRKIWLEPTLADLDDFYELYLKDAPLIAVDIENPREIISCISFAPSKDVAIVIPFEDERKPANSYWPTRAEEVAAWKWVKKVCETSKGLLAQNGIYDASHLAMAGIYLRNFDEDTMLLAHALQPEERKGLGHLGAMYAKGEDAWKTMGDFRGDKTIKRDQ